MRPAPAASIIASASSAPRSTAGAHGRARAPSPSGCRPAAPPAIRPRQGQAGQQPGRARRQDPERGGDGEHGGVERNLRLARRACGGNNRGERRNAPRAEHEAGDGRAQAEEHAFARELAEEAGPRRAERHAHRKLLLASSAAHELQGGHVRARHEQHERDHQRECQERRPNAAVVFSAQRHDRDAEPRIGFGIRGREARRECGRLRLRALERDPRREPREQAQRAPCRSCVRRSSVSGRHSRAPVAQNGANAKPSGMTPITVNASPSNVSARPTMAGSPAKRSIQSPWLRTTTRRCRACPRRA